MKKLVVGMSLLLLQSQSHALFGKKESEPSELAKLKKEKHVVPEYESFDDISLLTPVPSKFRLGLGAIIRMGVFRSQNINYEVAEPKEYNRLEKEIGTFFHHPSAERSLKLVSYARQINAESPYSINPFLPYFTLREENSLFADQKTGPAAVVADAFRMKGRVEGKIEYITPKGEKKKVEVEYKSQSLSQTGVMLLFDADFLSVAQLIERPRENVLQDVVLHEFTHIWHNELLSETRRNESTIGSSATENGHDAMIVSNPYLAFGEGLAEGLESIYGTAAAQYGLLTKEEREEFFGRFTPRARKGLDFLVNRQSYVRRNSYLYNLYDYDNCALRDVRAHNASDMDMTGIFDRYKWESFQERFYSDESLASTVYLMKNCEIDSPARLESKEGFIATIIYNLLYSGALVSSEKMGLSDVAMKNKKSKEAFSRFFTFAEKYESDPTSQLGRMIASNSDSFKEAQRIFLLGFRTLVTGIKASEAIRISDLVNYFLNDKGISSDIKIKVAYQLMKVTKGQWFKKNDDHDVKFSSYFKTPASIKENLSSIQEYLISMNDQSRLGEIVYGLGKTKSIHVTFPSHFYALQGARRINVNAAYHIDLIDMFGVNNKKIADLAKKMNKGFTFSSEKEFIEFAASFGASDRARAMIEAARPELLEANSLAQKGVRVKSIDKHSF